MLVFYDFLIEVELQYKLAEGVHNLADIQLGIQG